MPGRIFELMLFGLVPLAVGGLFLPFSFAAEEVKVSGQISYREWMALPSDAVALVELVDTSLADTPDAVIAKQTIDPAGQVPIGFSLDVDSAVLRANTAYALRASIMVGNAIWFVNDDRHQVDPLAGGDENVGLKRSGQG